MRIGGKKPEAKCLHIGATRALETLHSYDSEAKVQLPNSDICKSTIPEEEQH
jgi:hypothetical protein